jgi:hypothetical protein
MGGREDAGSSSREGEKKKEMKRTRSQSGDDASSSKSGAHKKKEEQHSRSDGGERYVCVQASLCAGGWQLSQCMPFAPPSTSHYQKAIISYEPPAPFSMHDHFPSASYFYSL